MSALPGLGQDERNRAPSIVLQNIERGRVSAAGADPVLERWDLVRNVLHHELDADVLEVIIDRVVSGIVAEREVERVHRRLNVAVIADQARERSSRNGGPGRDALEVHVRWSRLSVKIMRRVIHEAGYAPWPVDQAQTRAIAHPVGADAGDPD